MFDFMVEHRIPEISNAYINYRGDLCVEYEEYFNMGGSQTREIEFSVDELRKLLTIAEEHNTEYMEYMKAK